MSDVMQFAQNYRDQLKAEIVKVDEFFRFAETLMNESNSERRSISILSDATSHSMSSGQPVEMLSRSSVNGDAATPSEANSSLRTIGAVSLFRGTFGAN